MTRPPFHLLAASRGSGGEVLAPAVLAAWSSLSTCDLAEWTLCLIEAGKTGIFNAIGPEPRPAMGDLLETCRKVCGSEARFTWVDETFLARHEVGAWMELPLWIPETDPDFAGFFAFDNRKAIADGLTFRSLADTVAATLDWAKTRPVEHSWRAGISRGREAELLKAARAGSQANKINH
jgi:2'-hydroxyisoflavone reductase